MNLIVNRYKESELPAEARCADGEFPWESSVEPEDRSWVLFVPKPGKGEPQLWFAVGDTDNGDGSGERAYAAAGSPEHEAFLASR